MCNSRFVLGRWWALISHYLLTSILLPCTAQTPITNQSPFVAFDYHLPILDGGDVQVLPTVLSGGVPICEAQLWIHHSPVVARPGGPILYTNVLDASTASPYFLQWKDAPIPFEANRTQLQLQLMALDQAGQSNVSSRLGIGFHHGPWIVEAKIATPGPDAQFANEDTITLMARPVSDSGAIGPMDFFLGTNLVVSVSNPPYLTRLSDLVPGQYELTARLRKEQLGVVGSKFNRSDTLTFTILPPEQSFPVRLKPPEPDRFVMPANIRLEAEAAKPGGRITRVEFFDYTNRLGVVESPPYVFTWTNVTGQSSGFHWLTARATDDAGITISSDAVRISLYNETAAPYVDVVEPRAGSGFALGEPVRLRALMQLNDHTESPVEFYAGDQLLGTAPRPPYEITVTNLPAGEHVLRAQAWNQAGQRGTGVPAAIRVGQAALREPRRTDQGFEMRIEGPVSGRTNVVQASENLRDWQTLQTAVPLEHPWMFLDAESGDRAFRFYRVLLPPE